MMFLFILLMIPMFLLMIFIPYWTRKTESFGVSIPSDVFHQPVLRKMRKHYAWALTGLSLFASLLLLLLGTMYHTEKELSLLFGIMMVGYIGTGFIIYLKFHFNMKKLKTRENWYENRKQRVVVSTTFHHQKRTYSNYWFIISFVITLTTVVLSLRFYDLIPDRIPMQYDFSGTVTKWTDKTYRSVLFLPMMQVYLMLVFIFVNTIIAKAKQQISAENPEASLEQNMRFRQVWSIFIIVTGIALNSMFSLFQINYFFELPNWLLFASPIILTTSIIIAAIILSFKTGQGGSRMTAHVSPNGTTIDRDDDQYWKFGQFYVNKNDPALFLEKRFGVGWTVNWARPGAWLTFVLIIASAIILPLWLLA